MTPQKMTNNATCPLESREVAGSIAGKQMISGKMNKQCGINRGTGREVDS